MRMFRLMMPLLAVLGAMAAAAPAQAITLKERLVREVGYGLALEGASAAALVKSMSA